jgi:hypothetical protein
VRTTEAYAVTSAEESSCSASSASGPR